MISTFPIAKSKCNFRGKIEQRRAAIKKKSLECFIRSEVAKRFSWGVVNNISKIINLLRRVRRSKGALANKLTKNKIEVFNRTLLPRGIRITEENTVMQEPLNALMMGEF